MLLFTPTKGVNLNLSFQISLFYQLTKFSCPELEFANYIQELEFTANLSSSQQVGIYSSSISVELCDSNCLSCSYSSIHCTSCQLNTQYIQQSSHTCVYSCLDTEYELIDSFLSWPNFCISCSTPYCKTCPLNVCSQCLDGYYLDSLTNSCLVCSASLKCFSCLDSISCKTCISGYYLDGICKQCPLGCQICSDSVSCSVCALGYYLDSSKVCQVCLPQCHNCENGSYCIYCKTSYYLRLVSGTDNECLTDCGSNYFYDNLGLRCISFTLSNCAIPDATLGCSKSDCILPYSKYNRECQYNCQSGFYKNQYSILPVFYECKSCPSTCNTCTLFNLCQSCKNSNYLSKSSDGTTAQCLPCIANCYSCLNEKSCILCMSGYSLNDGLCVTTCPSPKYSNGKQCLNCGISYCDQCKSSYECKDCAIGYVPILNMCYTKCGYGTYREGTHSYCSNCPANCKDCTSNVTCNGCYDGYYLSSGICYICSSPCLTCSDSGTDKCLSCDSSKGYFLFLGRCITNCPDSYYLSALETCTSCTDHGCKICKGDNQCSKCLDSSNYLIKQQTCSASCLPSYFSYINSQGVLCCDDHICSRGYEPFGSGCKEICGDGLIFSDPCDDGNLLSGDGCSSTCSVEKDYQCTSSPSQCYFLVTYSLKQNPQLNNSFFIQLSTDVELINSSIFKISIVDINNQKFSYSIEPTSTQNLLLVSLKFSVQTSGSSQVQVSNPTDLNSAFSLILYSDSRKYIINSNTQTISIKTNYELNDSEVNLSNGVQTVATVLQVTILTAVIPLTLAGSINFVASVIDISQLIQLHQYIDIKYPYLLQLFFQVFNGFSFPFVTNFFDYAIPNDLTVNSYDSFTRYEVSALYLSNMGQQYSILLFSLLSHWILKQIGKKFKKIDEKTDEMFKYGVYHEVVMSTYLEIVFYTFLQWTNMDTEAPIVYLNHIVMFLTAILVFPIPFVAGYLMKKHFDKLDEKQIESKFGSLWEGLLTPYHCRIYYLYLHIRKIFFSLFIVFCNKVSTLQCILLIFPSIFLLFIVAKCKPFKKRSENWKQILQECCLIMGQIFLAALISFNNEVESKRTQLSWGVVFFFSMILIMHFFCSLIEIYNLFIHHILQLIVKIRERSKVKPCSENASNTHFQENEQQNSKNMDLSLIFDQASNKAGKNKQVISPKQNDLIISFNGEAFDVISSLKNIPRQTNAEAFLNYPSSQKIESRDPICSKQIFSSHNIKEQENHLLSQDQIQEMTPLTKLSNPFSLATNSSRKDIITPSHAFPDQSPELLKFKKRGSLFGKIDLNDNKQRSMKDLNPFLKRIERMEKKKNSVQLSISEAIPIKQLYQNERQFNDAVERYKQILKGEVKQDNNPQKKI